MNRSAAEAIAKKMGWSTIPSVIQMRICGAKGILLLHPDDKSDHPMIWLRDSQVKIKVLSPDHSQLTVDLVRPPLFAYPAKLSAEIIVNLGHNGVPHDIFVRLMREGLDKEVKRLTSWVGNHSMQRLWDAIFTTQGVFGSRMRQLLGAASRAHGFGENESDDGLDIEGDEDDDDEPVAWSTDEVSGLPSTLAEAVLAFLAAGFHPEACPPLMDKLKYLVKQTIEAYVLRYKITAPLSCTAFVAPGKIYLRITRFKVTHIGSNRSTRNSQGGRNFL
jgi:RNA-dependent RNA polymerase